MRRIPPPSQRGKVCKKEGGRHKSENGSDENQVNVNLEINSCPTKNNLSKIVIPPRQKRKGVNGHWSIFPPPDSKSTLTPTNGGGRAWRRRRRLKTQNKIESVTGSQVAQGKKEKGGVFLPGVSVDSGVRGKSKTEPTQRESNQGKKGKRQNAKNVFNSPLHTKVKFESGRRGGGGNGSGSSDEEDNNNEHLDYSTPTNQDEGGKKEKRHEDEDKNEENGGGEREGMNVLLVFNK